MRDYDYEIRRGETFEGCFFVVDTEDKPVNLEGMNANGQVRRTKENPQLVAEFQCALDTNTACVTYILKSDTTKNIPPGDYEYDICLWQDFGSGNTYERVVKYYIGGKFRVLKAVTNALSYARS